MSGTLNIIGAGRVGRTLGALWCKAGTFTIGNIVSPTEARARAAIAYIGQGTYSHLIDRTEPADVWMLSTPDDQIERCARLLAQSGPLRAGDVVFHCSGALSSAELLTAAEAGASVASVHPIKSFADVDTAVSTFAGTWCAAEGDDRALCVLQPAFERIAGRVIRIDVNSKLVYHAGNVMASNYLVSLMEAALGCYEQAGIARETALKMVAPLVSETLQNISLLGTARALTGPIARGDEKLVMRQLLALERTDSQIAALYRELGRIAVKLAREKGEASAQALDAVSNYFNEGSRGNMTRRADESSGT